MGLLRGFRDGAKAAGVQYLKAEIAGLVTKGDRITGVRLTDGQHLDCDMFVNASGTRAAGLAAEIGADLPVEPRKRTVFVFTCAAPPLHPMPLMIEPDGTWSRPEGTGFICSCTPPSDPAVDPQDFEPQFDLFEDLIWPKLAARVPAFEAIRQTSHWVGQYDYNTADQNAVLGAHPQVSNFLFANGFSGHGLQQAPAVGRGLAEWIATGGWQTLDLSPLGFSRFARGVTAREEAVI